MPAYISSDDAAVDCAAVDCADCDDDCCVQDIGSISGIGTSVIADVAPLSPMKGTGHCHPLDGACKSSLGLKLSSVVLLTSVFSSASLMTV